MLKVDFTGINQFQQLADPSWAPKIIKSTGWMLQQKMKKLAKSGKAPRGSNYSMGRRLPETLRAHLERRSARTKDTPLGELVNAVGYEYRGNDLFLGWLSRWGAYYGKILQEGRTLAVTAAMRKKFAAAGLNPPGKSIRIAPYNFIEPAFRQFEPEIPGYVEDKILSYIANGVPGSYKPKRKHVVYG